ncbi:MAG: hypothetical protein AAF614_09980 [Chloroflexota bacterium]
MSKYRLLLGLIIFFIGFVTLWFWQRSGVAPQIAYLGWDEAGEIQVFVVDQDGGSAPRQFTNHQAPTALFDFAVAPNGEQIAYSLLDGAGGSEIWLVRGNGRSAMQIHSCPTTLCTDLVWHPTQNRLLFEQREDERALPFLWWLDVDSGQTVPLLTDNQQPGLAARFSPQGDWVSYVSPIDDGVVLYNFSSGADGFAASVVGVPATWQPQGTAVVVSDLDISFLHGNQGEGHDEHSHDTSEAIHLFKVDIASGEQTALTEALNVDDGVAAWSPDGAWVAFGRKVLKTAVGRQLWLVSAAGGEARPLTDEPLLHHGPPRWSPDGRLLLFQRFDPQNGGGKAAVFTLEWEMGELKEIVGEGMQPVWLP